MNRDTALKLVNEKINGPRFEHTLRVVDSAKVLAKDFGADVKKAELAAILHDYAKLTPVKDLQAMILKGKEDGRLLDYHPELWHGPAAAYIFQSSFGIKDSEVLNAIRYHTTGRAKMKLLEKVVYLADYIEPGRDFPGVDEVRTVAKHHLDQAMMMALQNTIRFLLEKGAPIFPDTFEAYNDLSLNRGGNKS